MTLETDHPEAKQANGCKQQDFSWNKDQPGKFCGDELRGYLQEVLVLRQGKEFAGEASLDYEHGILPYKADYNNSRAQQKQEPLFFIEDAGKAFFLEADDNSPQHNHGDGANDRG